MWMGWEKCVDECDDWQNIKGWGIGLALFENCSIKVVRHALQRIRGVCGYVKFS